MQVEHLSLQVNKDVELITMLQATEAQARAEVAGQKKIIEQLTKQMGGK